MLRSSDLKPASNLALVADQGSRRSAVRLSVVAIGLGLLVLGLSVAAAGSCLAAEPAIGAKGVDAASAPAAASDPRPDEAERKKVIESPQWHAMQHDLMEWLSVQKVYTPSRLRKVKAELNAKVARMSPQELVDFMVDMEAKLKIMMSPTAEEARLWVEQRLANQVNLTPEQLKQMRPDVLNMTSAQLDERLQEWQAQRKQTIAVQAAFVKGRQTEVKNIEAMEKDEEHERDEALNRAYSEMNYGSPYGAYYNRGNANTHAGGYYGMYGTDYYGYGGGFW